MVCTNINKLIFFSNVVKSIRPTYGNKKELAALNPIPYFGQRIKYIINLMQVILYISNAVFIVEDPMQFIDFEWSVSYTFLYMIILQNLCIISK